MDMFADPMAELLARIEALEAAVFAKAPKPAKDSPEALGEAWAQWESYRHGKGWTANARALNMRKLRELAGTDGVLAVKVVQQSIERGWSGLFPLKQDAQTATVTPLYKPAAEAMKPAEDRLTAHLTWLAQQRYLGALDPDQYRAEVSAAKERFQ